MIDVPSESKGRAKYFGDKAHRQAVGLKDKEVAMEFCNGLLGTSPSLVSIRHPSSSLSLLVPFYRCLRRSIVLSSGIMDEADDQTSIPSRSNFHPLSNYKYP
jgi:hypothetical protein